MKKYELIRERFTACSGDRHPQTTMEELTLQDPAAYVQDLFHLEKHLRIDQRQAWSLTFTPAASTSDLPLPSCDAP